MEILVVLVILAGMAVIGLPRLFKNNDNIRKVARNFTTLTKEVRNRARLKNVTARLVFDMTAEPHRYWVEYTQGSAPVDANLYDPRRVQDYKPATTYVRDEVLTKKERELPSNLYFAVVETVNTREPVSQGMVYIHFFPEGFVEGAVIQVTNRKDLTWTFAISPLTGQAQIFEEAKLLKDMN